MSGKLKLAIYSSNGFQETFTKAHIDLLPVTYVITEGTPPRLVNGKPMLPMNKLAVLIRKVKSLFGIKIKPFDPLNYFFSKNKVDVFIAEFGMAGAVVAPICQKFDVPLIVNFYGIDAFGHKILNENRDSYKFMFAHAKFISVQSLSIRNKLIELGCNQNKIVVNSCPPSDKFLELKPSLNNLNLISVGRFVEKKAPILLIKSFIKILEEFPEAQLIMVGDGPLLEETSLFVESSGLKEKVILTGRLNPEEQIKRMMNASIFIQHSITAKDGDSEGLPVAIMEASSMGLPVVSTFHSGIPEAIEHEKTGFLVNEYDYEEMAKYCILLLKSKDLRIKFGEQGKLKMQREFTMKMHIDRMNDLINKVMS